MMQERNLQLSNSCVGVDRKLLIDRLPFEQERRRLGHLRFDSRHINLTRCLSS